MSWLNELLCKHSHPVVFDGREAIRCIDCGKEWPISPALTRASGVYAEIEQRVEQQHELERLVKQAEKYMEE